jgi:hypothetical protein
MTLILLVCAELHRYLQTVFRPLLENDDYSNLMWMKIQHVVLISSCEHGNEPSGSLKGGKLLEHICDFQLLRKDHVLCN